MTEPLIEFVRLPEVPILEVLDVLNEPRNGRHLPLAGERFTETTASEWVAAKDGEWKVHGYGPWAVLVDGEFAGWGGFQHEENRADFALVLKPTQWGHGAAVTRARHADHLGWGRVRILLASGRFIPIRRPACETPFSGFRPSEFPLLIIGWIVLRELRKEDAADLLVFRGDAEEQRFSSGHSRPLNQDPPIGGVSWLGLDGVGGSQPASEANCWPRRLASPRLPAPQLNRGPLVAVVVDRVDRVDEHRRVGWLVRGNGDHAVTHLSPGCVQQRRAIR